MKILLTSAFKKSIKRMKSADKSELDNQVRAIIESPENGDPKKGDLAGVFTVGFKMHGAQHRIAYCYDENAITLIAFGTRENFYSKLKR